MKNKFSFFVLYLSILLHGHSQTVSLKNTKVNEKEELSELKALLGFNSFAFCISPKRFCYVNFYVEEFLNDSLISKHDLYSTKGSYSADLLDMIFPKSSRKNTLIRFYTYSRSDTVEQVVFRFGGMEMIQSLRVNKKELNYDWSCALEGLNQQKAKIAEKMALLYYSTGVLDESPNGEVVSRFCSIPNIINHKSIAKGPTKLRHYFVVGVQFLEKL